MATSKLEIRLHGKNAETQQQDQNLEFANSAYALSRTIEINSTRGTSDELISEKLDQKDLVEFEFEDGTIWVTPSPEINTLFPSNNRSEETSTFIPNALEIPTENRSIVRKVYLKFVKIFKPKEVVAEFSAMIVAAKIESGIIENEGVAHVDANFKLSPFSQDEKDPGIDETKPVLFFLHGTSSSTVGSFGEMEGTDTWEEFCRHYGSNILALEHRTWTKSPFENALDAINALPKNTKLHVISHSRGGLVGEVLCRCSSPDSLFSPQEIKLLKDLGRDNDVTILKQLNKVARQKNIVVEKFVRVACPAAGTTILTKRIDHFLNILLNVIGYGTGLKTNPLFVGIKSLLLAIVEQRTDPNVLPGLECMVPSTPLQKIINNHQIKIKSDLAIIAGNSGMGGIKKTLLTIMSKLFYRMDNDFVVDTDSMYMGVVRENDIYYKFVDGGAVDHFCYFKNKNSRNNIFTAITSPRFDSPPEFKTVNRGERNRNITTILPGGSLEPTPVSGDKPIVILIPGIMGSNLSNGDSEIWIDYLKMASGKLMQLNMGNKNVSAKSVVGTAYGKLVVDLSDKYDVVVFPYDWRKSLSDSGKILADKINKELLPTEQSIQIIAHSMGGLVTRDVMMNHPKTWEKLNAIPNFKCILLGTPWQGSYGIPEIITGMGGPIKSVSRLAIFQSRKDLLEVFVQYSGLLQLLPIYEGAHDFDDLELWKTLQAVTDDSLWALPNQKDLEEFKTYKKKFHQFKDWNLNKVFYIAGKDDRTLSNFVCRDQYGAIINEKNTTSLKTGITKPGLFTHKNYELVFEATGEGDGSVTWDSGIPKQLEAHQVFYADTIHGELANDQNRFEAIKDILANGTTNRLPNKRPTSRAIQSVLLIENEEILSNDVNILAKNILGLSTDPIYHTKNNEKKTDIKVVVKNGHLRYATYPILVGHFKDDGIVSAEYVIDSMLNHKLSEREAFGLYPGDIGTNLVHLEDQMHDIGVVVIGLGSVENLTPFKLSETIELGCLEYLLSVCKNENKDKNDKVGISTLLIGSNYANLSLNNSINAILEGIINANKKVQNMGTNLPIIAEIEFIELYKDKADETFFTLNQIQKRNSFYHIDLEHPLERVDGARSFLPLNSQKEWWRRITATIKKDPISKSKHLVFSASTGRAMVEINESFANLHIIDALLDDNKKHTNWDRELTKAVFELLIPNEFKISFRNQQNILLILDHKTASYPWELLNYDENLEMPIVVSAGMIRQLATSHSRKMIKPVIENSALIIGDPILDKKSGVPQLPEAAIEAKMVDRLLQAHGYETTPRIQQPFREIFKKLYDEYKIIHIASHGVIDYGEDKKTGILLSNNIVLTAAEINQISSTPELVFINSCYMGNVSPDKEEYFRGKYKLAANIGVQFIENGVKAVVVAGWAVDDSAAKRFAEVFYDRMLAGENFADAVKAARATCFREFHRNNKKKDNQCYGDQYYQLVKKPQKSGEEYQYILEKEILIDLENLIDDTKSNRKRGVNFLEKLQLISRGIDETNLRNARITELEIRAYVELQEYETALQKFEVLFKEKEATFSVKALELWCNCKIKVLTKMNIDGNKKYLMQELKKTIKKMNDLLELGETSERHNLMGSIQKRQFMIFDNLDNLKKQRNAIIESANHYRKGYEIGQETYSLTSWIIAEKLINDEKRMKELDEVLGKNTLAYIEESLDILDNNKKDHDEFWDIIKPVNLKQAELLFYIDEMDDKKSKTSANLKKRKTIVTSIKNLYSHAWKIGGGSPRHIASEILQMEFILKSMIDLEKAKPAEDRRNLETTINAMDELIDFFREIR
ncbi:MAG: CHAT domain-containing protein [Saprospiraceae bacterium]